MIDTTHTAHTLTRALWNATVPDQRRLVYACADVAQLQHARTALGDTAPELLLAWLDLRLATLDRLTFAQAVECGSEESRTLIGRDRKKTSTRRPADGPDLGTAGLAPDVAGEDQHEQPGAPYPRDVDQPLSAWVSEVLTGVHFLLHVLRSGPRHTYEHIVTWTVPLTNPSGWSAQTACAAAGLSPDWLALQWALDLGKPGSVLREAADLLDLQCWTAPSHRGPLLCLVGRVSGAAPATAGPTA